MKLWVLLGVCLLLLYLRPRIREHLEPTDRIKDPGPNDTYDEAETDRIWSIMPEDVHREFTTVENPDEAQIRAGKEWLSLYIASFYRVVYAQETAPITESRIAAYVNRYINETPQFKEIRAKALKIYFIDQPSPPPPPPTTGPPAPTDSTAPSDGVPLGPVRVPPPPADGPAPIETRPIPGAPVTITVEIHPDGTTRVTNPRLGARGIPGN
jgi:hypothetical protein